MLPRKAEVKLVRKHYYSTGRRRTFGVRGAPTRTKLWRVCRRAGDVGAGVAPKRVDGATAFARAKLSGIALAVRAHRAHTFLSGGRAFEVLPCFTLGLPDAFELGI